MNHEITLADLVTLSNGLLGFLAITYVIDGRFFEASSLIILCVAIDGIDGMIARRMGTSHKMGAYLDLFSDSVSFCFAPALLVYTLYYDKALGRAWVSPINAAATGVPMLMVFFGVLRLSRFADKESFGKNYRGLPVPVIALFVVIITSIDAYLNPWVIFGSISLLSALLYSNIRYPKLRGPKWLFLGSILLLTAFMGGIFTKISYVEGNILLFAALMMCITYVAIGPIVVDKHGKKYGRDS